MQLRLQYHITTFLFGDPKICKQCSNPDLPKRPLPKMNLYKHMSDSSHKVNNYPKGKRMNSITFFHIPVSGLIFLVLDKKSSTLLAQVTHSPIQYRNDMSFASENYSVTRNLYRGYRAFSAKISCHQAHSGACFAVSKLHATVRFKQPSLRNK